MADQARLDAERRYSERRELIDKLRFDAAQKERLRLYAEAGYNLQLLSITSKELGIEPDFTKIVDALIRAKDDIITYGGRWDKKIEGYMQRDSDGAKQFGNRVTLPEDTRSLAERL